ncbi:cysteine/glutathione ABC transporter membrane /ATP-binding component [Serratia rubidaea]|uniref:Cysteine/glutathione ABC transporter membrane /ATP-binding component n=1 Tax=Serratia rubidaea TaxID=61652 RepID=A0A4U9HES5_SERRU|nr:cysteine/glutathione ABC transporter membrane /ATP-binding component [Serratia rubidaea]
MVSHDATFRVLAHLRVFTFSKILPLSPGGIARFRQAEVLNRLVADVDTLDHLYLRVISPLVSAAVVIVVVTFGLSFVDQTLALILGGILLLLLVLVPPLFYAAGKPIGGELTALRSQYRTGLTAWLQGQAELVVFGAVNDFRPHARSHRTALAAPSVATGVARRHRTGADDSGRRADGYPAAMADRRRRRRQRPAGRADCAVRVRRAGLL